MIDISTLPNIDTATANRDLGVMKDDIVPGDGAGTPVREDWQQDMYYGIKAILDLAGIAPDGSEEGAVTSQIATAFIRASEPVGITKPWDKSFPNTPALPSWYVECDGSLISDSDSPYNGYRSRNLNGADVILNLSWTADAGGAFATVPATDITALAVGDDVSGSGIASGTTITDITGTTVTISDVAASGSISSTFTNRGQFVRGSQTSGDGQNDAMQRITGNIISMWVSSSAASSFDGVFEFESAGAQNRASGGASSSADVLFDSANSTSPNPAKTDDIETRPINTSMVMIMKIK